MNSEYIEDVPVCEVKRLLIIKAKDQELNYEQKLALEHAKLFSKLTPANAEKLKTTLIEKLEMTNELANKIADILPNKVELDLIFEKEEKYNDEQKEEIIALIEKYKKEWNMVLKKEAIVLDKVNKEIKFKQTPVIYCIGTSNFSLLEVIAESPVKILDVIDTDGMIVRRVTYDRISNDSKKELEKVVEGIVKNNPEKFVNFFNTAKPISLKRHQLDLLPMIGKKHRDAILEHIRKKGKFNSFEDINQIEMMPDPLNIIVNRIIEEIKEGPENKYCLFTMPFLKKF